MTKKKAIIMTITFILLAASIGIAIVKLIPVSVEDKISSLNDKITLQERLVLEHYSIYARSELDWKDSKITLDKLYWEKKELMWLAVGFTKTQ